MNIASIFTPAFTHALAGSRLSIDSRWNRLGARGVPKSDSAIAAGCKCSKHRYLTMARVDFLGIIDYRVDKRRSAQRSLDSRTAAADRESTIYTVQSKHIDYVTVLM